MPSNLNRRAGAIGASAKRTIVFAACATTVILSMQSPVAGAADTKAAKGAAVDQSAGSDQISRGRYLVTVGNCNDCHTADFAPKDGKVAEKDWLMGSGPLGFRGPWGTTYPTNLRINVSKMSEAEWVKMAKTLKARPPMPWFNLNQWQDSDLKALYQYIKQLGPVGEPSKAPLPPGEEPKPPFIQWPSPPK
jgi:mono/diheme cytochrome c family protein